MALLQPRHKPSKKLLNMSHFKIRTLPLAIALAWPTLSLLCGQALAADEKTNTLPLVTVSDSKPDNQPAGGTVVNQAKLPPKLSATSDTASLLSDIPGLSLYGAGGVSSLPVIHGLADDRLRIKVDGMALISACANHMNPPLSYIDPTSVGSIQVFAGITPVSVGGDSIGGAIIVNSAAPEFAKPGESTLVKGQAGTFYRSNGSAKGANVSATVATDKLNLTYSGSTTESGNYEAAEAFKSAMLPTQKGSTTAWPGPKDVGSSLYKSQNQSVGLAMRHENHLVELKLGFQDIPYQGFPNQRMDMTSNKSDQVNLRYTGQYAWGGLEARVYNENTRHKMNFLDNKLQTTNLLGMPMDTEGKNTGALVKADIVLSERDILRVGSEFQQYRLNDWWDAIGPYVAGQMMLGMKGPGPFKNINDGQRDRFDIFGEWEAHWSSQWLSQLGVRSSTMTMNTGMVNGYNTTNYPAASYAAFNAADRSKTDNNIDLSALVRYTLDAEKTFEGGFARKTRSPNLYERYVWSTNNTMVMNMINWVGDGNGYVGNINLKPEIANTLSATADWHDASRQQWGVQVTPYYTYIQDYIDAASCASVGKTCLVRTDGFSNLSFANQNARLLGMDVSGYKQLAKTSDYGNFTATGMISYVQGKNTATDGNLYNIMPLNVKLAIVQRMGKWTNSLETQLVDAKNDVSQIRNEIKTAGYGLLNLRSSYEWNKFRLDIGVENVLDKWYASPLGGAYVGEGNGMGTGATSGIAVPGAGRSINIGVTVKF